MGTLRDQRGSLLLAGGLLALLTVGGATAAPLVLYRSLPSRDPIGTVKQQMQDRLGFGDSQLTRVIPLAEYAFEGARVWPLDDGVAFCGGGRHPDLEAAISDAETALDTLDFPRARSVIEPLLDDLACVGRDVSSLRLARAALLLGYARFQLDDRAGATAAFGQAAAFYPDLEWDSTYPPDAQQVFNNAVLDSLRQQAAILGGSLEGVNIDGGPVADDRKVRPGWHLLSVPRAEGGSVRLAVHLDPDERLDLGEAARMVDELFEGGRGFAATLAALRSHVNGEGDPETYLVDSERARILRFFGGSGELRELPGGAVADDGGRGDDDDGGDDDDDGGARNGGTGRTVAGGLRKPVKLGLGIGGGALLLGGMGIAVGTGINFANRCFYSKADEGQSAGNIHFQGLIPFAGPGLVHYYWSQLDEDCNELSQGYFPLAIVLTVAEVAGAALVVIALFSPLDDGDGAVGERPRMRKSPPLLLPSLTPDGASLTLVGRF